MDPIFTGCAAALVTPFKNGAVDYDVHLLRPADDADGVSVGDVEIDGLQVRRLRDVGEDESVSAACRGVADLPAQLAVGPCD